MKWKGFGWKQSWCTLGNFKKGMKRTTKNFKKVAGILNRYPWTWNYSRNSYRHQFFLALVCIRKGRYVRLHTFGCPFGCLEVFFLCEEISSFLILLVPYGPTGTCKDMLYILYISESKHPQTEQSLRQCWVRNNSLCSVVQFYAGMISSRPRINQTLHYSRLSFP